MRNTLKAKNEREEHKHTHTHKKKVGKREKSGIFA